MFNMRNRGPMAMLLALVALVLTSSLAKAGTTISQQAIDRAHGFLKAANRGKDVLSYVHFGAQYNGHTFRETKTVLNRPGHFALVYRYNWENDGITDLAFLCDTQGNVYQVQVTSTNAILSQPYALANLSINILGNLFIGAFQQQMTPNQLQQARQLVDNANARGLLEMSLPLQQAFGQ